MKKISILLSLFLVWSSAILAQAPQEFYVLVGTYTSKASKGIYVYKFNTATGELQFSSVVSGVKNPSFITLSPNQKFAYSVGETDGDGTVNAFSFDKQSGSLSFLNSESAGGAGPCHITTDRTGKWVIAGNYGGGSLSILPILGNGTVGKATQTIQHTGHSVNASRQEKPHVHSINVAPNNQDVFVPDLGVDKIYTYSLDTQKGLLNEGKPAYTSSIAGSGPRHFTFHPNGKWAYVIEELSATVTAYRYQKGGLKATQTISTLPADYTGKKWCADIHISPDGKFLYASNRSHESITVYAINTKTGQLTWVDNTNVAGKTPRNFAIDPTGNYILVANQDSDNITIFKRDKATGKFTYTGTSVEVSMPVCLQWANVK
ncbi:lactonase family protein [Flectobacillus major]|uniref:lactonase family protein n=1 Tax=Flectobacillus major TaxID=103 RepID=UPI0005C78735|nr:lactonase family protein [Flectobacillus major]